MAETVITIVIPDGQEDQKAASILLRRGDHARIKTFTFSTLTDLAQAAHDLSIEVQEIEFSIAPPQEGGKKATRKKSAAVAPVGVPTQTPEPSVAADFAEKQLLLF